MNLLHEAKWGPFGLFLDVFEFSGVFRHPADHAFDASDWPGQGPPRAEAAFPQGVIQTLFLHTLTEWATGNGVHHEVPISTWHYNMEHSQGGRVIWVRPSDVCTSARIPSNSAIHHPQTPPSSSTTPIIPSLSSIVHPTQPYQHASQGHHPRNPRNKTQKRLPQGPPPPGSSIHIP